MMVRWTIALLLPLVGFFILLAQDGWDGHWENHKCALLAGLRRRTRQRGPGARDVRSGAAGAATHVSSSSGSCSCRPAAFSRCTHWRRPVCCSTARTPASSSQRRSVSLSAAASPPSRPWTSTASSSVAIVRRERWIGSASSLLLAGWAVWSLDLAAAARRSPAAERRDRSARRVRRRRRRALRIRGLALLRALSAPPVLPARRGHRRVGPPHRGAAGDRVRPQLARDLVGVACTHVPRRFCSSLARCGASTCEAARSSRPSAISTWSTRRPCRRG